ncbi:MAG TPA: hypothetical protein DEP72_07005 [Clostridiales bacterium]|nr:hypothetical protein [Clostridiales bacterium]
MLIDEVMKIVSSDDDIAVYYGPQKVRIEDVDEETEIVTIRLLMDQTIEHVNAIDLKCD